MAPRPNEPVDPNRQLMIKVKTCQRLIKEVSHYKKELSTNQSRLQEMLAAEKDTYDIKLFRQVVEESLLMVPDSEKRMGSAMEDLREFLSSAQEELQGEWMEMASAILAEHGNDGEKEETVATTSLDDLAEGEAF